jgi:transposase
LSDFAGDGAKSVHANDIIVDKGKNAKVIEVPLLKPSNFVAKMSVDEKLIGEDLCTVMTNRDSGKIAMVCRSVQFSEIAQVFKQHPDLAPKVRSITRDLSSLYEKVCTAIFPDAIQVADKFHVIRNLIEAHQGVRIRYRQKELEKRRKAFKEFKAGEQKRLLECQRWGKDFKPGKFHYKEHRYQNGETALELLARSRYLLFKYSHQWTDSQRKRAKVLFEYFPEISVAYQLSCQFRDFLSRKNVGKDYLKTDYLLHNWYERVEESQIDEMLSFKSMIESNEEVITNYFIQGETNAMAEALNGKIQKFISSNQGTRDRDFFFYRLKLYYS